MKKYLILILLLFIVLLTGCEIINLLFYNDKPHEYNPQKAGADIAARITLPSKAHYATYDNSHCYILNDNNISVYDLTNDRLSLHYQIPFDINIAFHDESGDYRYSINECIGLMITQNKILSVLSIIKRNRRNNNEEKYFWNVLSVEYDNQNNKWGDVTSDMQIFPVKQLDYNQTYWYDNSDDILYAGSYGYNKVDSVTRIVKYKYSTQSESYESKEKIEFIYGSKYDANCMNKLLLTCNLFMYYVCYWRPVSGWSERYLTVYPNYQTQQTITIQLDYLCLFRDPYSAFADNNGNIWLYRNEYDETKKKEKYELVKLKLLE